MIYLTFLLHLSVAMASNPCERILKEDVTQKFISYLSELSEKKILMDRELLLLIEGLNNGEWINPISKNQKDISTIALIQYEGIQNYLNSKNLNNASILEWAISHISESSRIKLVRNKIEEETKYPIQKIEFLPIPKGNFLYQVDTGFVPYMMGQRKKRVVIKYPSEVMSTLVTQKQWADLMGSNPSYFIKPDGSMQPNHPVEQVSFFDAVGFANKLSEQNGFKPAYSYVNNKLVLDNQARGYRLPTDIEQVYLLKAAGRSFHAYHFGEDRDQLQDYAWFQENSGDTTHAVAMLKPMIIDGHEFYDVIGNVWEWGSSDVSEDGEVRLRGGSFATADWTLAAEHHSNNQAKVPFAQIGFRLVRTLNEKK